MLLLAVALPIDAFRIRGEEAHASNIPSDMGSPLDLRKVHRWCSCLLPTLDVAHNGLSAIIDRDVLDDNLLAG